MILLGLGGRPKTFLDEQFPNGKIDHLREIRSVTVCKLVELYGKGFSYSDHAGRFMPITRIKLSFPHQGILDHRLDIHKIVFRDIW